MNNQNITNYDDLDAALIGKQQLLIKSLLAEQNALVAKQQLAVKSSLAQKRQLTSQQ